MSLRNLSKESQKELMKSKNNSPELFIKYSLIDDKRISIVLCENFPFGDELKIKLEEIVSLEKAKNYFIDEISIINFKYYFYNNFYRFLFHRIVNFDELNIGTKKDEKEKEKYFNDALPGNDFETRLKASISYSKYVTKRFFELYPYLKTQLKNKSSLVEYYSTEKFQRLMMLIDLKGAQFELKETRIELDESNSELSILKNQRRTYSIELMKKIKEIETTKIPKPNQTQCIIFANREINEFDESDLIDFVTGKPKQLLVSIRDAYKSQKKSL